MTIDILFAFLAGFLTAVLCFVILGRVGKNLEFD